MAKQVHKILIDAFWFYAANWKKFISAYVSSWVLGLVFTLLSPFISKAYSEGSLSSLALAGLLLIVVAYAAFVVGGMISLAVIKSFHELVEKKKFDSWTAYFRQQHSNAIALAALYIAVGMAVLAGVFVFSLLFGMMFALVVGAVVFLAVVLGLSFVGIELAVANEGLKKAVKSSVSLVNANKLKMAWFYVVWAVCFLLLAILFSLPLNVVALLTNAPVVAGVANVAVQIVFSLFVTPIMAFSEVVLWMELKKEKQHQQK